MMTTWNCRGLVTTKQGLRKKKIAALARYIREADIIALREARGSHTLLNEALGHIRESFFVLADISLHGAGVLQFLSAKLFASSKVYPFNPLFLAVWPA